MGKKNNSYKASYKLKVISFAELLEYSNKTQIKISTKKSAYFTHPYFSAAKIEKKVRKLREQIRYLLILGAFASLLSASESRSVHLSAEMQESDNC
jgi:hypothetical protein